MVPGVVLLCYCDVFLMVLARYRELEVQVSLVLFRCFGYCIASSLLCGFACVVSARVPAVSKLRWTGIDFSCHGVFKDLVGKV